MRRWRLWFILSLLLCAPILLSRASGPDLLADTDTAFLLKTVRERNAPLSWFVGDWPLQNHFYRPLPTLTFELDNMLYGDRPAGYGLTNAILCSLCTLALFWALLELSESPPWAFAGCFLLTLWTLDLGERLSLPIVWVAAAIPLIGLYRHSFRLQRFLPASFVLLFLALQVQAPGPFASEHAIASKVMAWLPGRTASVMTLFALLAIASYVRYERGRNRRTPFPPASAMDTAAGMRTGRNFPPKHPWMWLAISYLMLAAALASYEQAIMIPACFVAIGVYLRLTRLRPNWTAIVCSWLFVVGYVLLRHALIPAGPSAYQAQQFRHGPGVWTDLLAYAAPDLTGLQSAWINLQTSMLLIIGEGTPWLLLAAACTVVASYQARRNWKMAVLGWSLSFLAFLPMAWLKQFGHYHYFPLALRTVLLLAMGKVAWDLVSIAVCPPERQAPKRLSPAPGSLPRR